MLPKLNIGDAISRRTLLTSATLIAAASSARAQRQTSIFAYVGSYTPNGQGIYLMNLDLIFGVLTQVKVAAAIPSPSWMEIHPNGKYLYAVNEISNFNGGTTGSVTAFSINRTTGDLTLLNVVSSQGAGPAHLSVDPLGQFVFVANYGGGNIAVLPILGDGSLGNASDVHLDTGSVGPLNATNAPPGSFAISGHDAPHAHMIQADLAGKYVLSTDLGQDRIYSWILNRSNGTLTPNTPPFTSLPPGDGPRHFAFHPSGQYLYSIQEEASTIVLWLYNAATGALTFQQQISSLPAGFTGTDFTSEIRVSPDGYTVYGANRLHNSIGVFSVRNGGMLVPADNTWTRGDYPRSFTLDPTKSWLIACNQRSDNLTVFHVAENGTMTFTGQYIPIGSPAIVVFLK